MSDATYRIDTEHRPAEPSAIRWAAYITLISEDTRVGYVFRRTEEDALIGAVEWVREQWLQLPGRTFFVDDQGEPVEQHSVKA